MIKALIEHILNLRARLHHVARVRHRKKGKEIQEKEHGGDESTSPDSGSDMLDITTTSDLNLSLEEQQHKGRNISGTSTEKLWHQLEDLTVSRRMVPCLICYNIEEQIPKTDQKHHSMFICSLLLFCRNLNSRIWSSYILKIHSCFNSLMKRQRNYSNRHKSKVLFLSPVFGYWLCAVHACTSFFSSLHLETNPQTFNETGR